MRRWKRDIFDHSVRRGELLRVVRGHAVSGWTTSGRLFLFPSRCSLPVAGSPPLARAVSLRPHDRFLPAFPSFSGTVTPRLLFPFFFFFLPPSPLLPPPPPPPPRPPSLPPYFACLLARDSGALPSAYTEGLGGRRGRYFHLESPARPPHTHMYTRAHGNTPPGRGGERERTDETRDRGRGREGGGEVTEVIARCGTSVPRNCSSRIRRHRRGRKGAIHGSLSLSRPVPSSHPGG